MTTDEKIKLCRIVGVLLLTDGHLDDEEVEYLSTLMNGLGLDDDDQHAVMDRIESSSEVLEDAASLRAHAQPLLEALQEAARADGIIAASEVDLIKMVNRVLAGSGMAP